MNINATLFGQALSFAILIWFTFKFVWPPLLSAIEERQKKIADGLAAADRARAELADADARVADEIKKARAEAQSQYNAILDRAKEDAVVEGNRRKAAAEAEIANLSNAARDVLRQQVAMLAVAGAEKILKREIDANRHRDLLNELAQEI
jgi:F-type H+-transporting ATPase subunit b